MEAWASYKQALKLIYLSSTWWSFHNNGDDSCFEKKMIRNLFDSQDDLEIKFQTIILLDLKFSWQRQLINPHKTHTTPMNKNRFYQNSKRKRKNNVIKCVLLLIKIDKLFSYFVFVVVKRKIVFSLSLSLFCAFVCSENWLMCSICLSINEI